MEAAKHERAREILGYDAPWADAGVLDAALLDEQARLLDEDVDASKHPEHLRWTMWRRYWESVRSLPLDDARLEALLALDSHEASRAMGFGHGIVLDLAAASALTEVQRTRVASHPVTHGLSGKMQASLLRKLAAPRRR